MKNTITILATCAALAGCVTQPSTGEIAIQAGPAPTVEDSEQAVRAYLLNGLKDPDSLKQFRITGGPTYFTWYRGLVNGGGHDGAWLVCFEYNAKNSYGGYTGVKADGYALRISNSGAQVVPWVNWGLATRRCV